MVWRTLQVFIDAGHADAGVPLRTWYRVAEKAEWASLADVRAGYPSADLVGNKLLFNIGGNKYRLIVRVGFVYHDVRVKWIGTHAENDRLSRKDIEPLWTPLPSALFATMPISKTRSPAWTRSGTPSPERRSGTSGRCSPF